MIHASYNLEEAKVVSVNAKKILTGHLLTLRWIFRFLSVTHHVL